MKHTMKYKKQGHKKNLKCFTSKKNIKITKIMKGIEKGSAKLQ